MPRPFSLALWHAVHEDPGEAGGSSDRPADLSLAIFVRSVRYVTDFFEGPLPSLRQGGPMVSTDWTIGGQPWVRYAARTPWSQRATHGPLATHYTV